MGIGCSRKDSKVSDFSDNCAVSDQITKIEELTDKDIKKFQIDWSQTKFTTACNQVIWMINTVNQMYKDIEHAEYNIKKSLKNRKQILKQSQDIIEKNTNDEIKFLRDRIFYEDEELYLFIQRFLQSKEKNDKSNKYDKDYFFDDSPKKDIQPCDNLSQTSNTPDSSGRSVQDVTNSDKSQKINNTSSPDRLNNNNQSRSPVKSQKNISKINRSNSQDKLEKEKTQEKSIDKSQLKRNKTPPIKSMTPKEILKDLTEKSQKIIELIDKREDILNSETTIKENCTFYELKKQLKFKTTMSSNYTWVI